MGRLDLKPLGACIANIDIKLMLVTARGMPDESTDTFDPHPTVITAIGIVATKQSHHIGVAIKAAVTDNGARGRATA